jgi:CheY-like chemotaxis protein
MNLDYKILWFENDRGSFNAKQRLIKRVVENFGFNFPEPQNEVDGENINTINFQIYDLIIADLNLDNGDQGTSLLETIRGDKGIYTEVVFYSSIGEAALREELKKFKIDGVYCAGRANEEFQEKVEKVIETTIKKVQDVNNMRGLVIAETIYLEHKIESILLRYFTVIGEQAIEEKKKKLLEHIYQKKVSKHESDVIEIKKINFSEIKTLIERDILTASNSFDAIHSILKDKLSEINVSLNIAGITPEIKTALGDKKQEVTGIKTELNNFRNEILKIRNTLAHVKEEIGEDGIPFLNSLNDDGTIIKFDNEKYTEIRRNLKKHSSNLDSILEHVF